MELVYKNVLNHFLPKVGGLSSGKVRKPTMSIIEEIPIGIIQVYPEIIYTRNVEISFYRLECARKSFTFESEQRILEHIKSEPTTPGVISNKSICTK